MKTRYQSHSAPNSISEEDAARIAARYGIRLEEMRRDFVYANQCGQEIIRGGFSVADAAEQAALNATHSGRYHDATFLFDGYCRDMVWEARAESVAYARYEEAAFGGRYGQEN